MGRGITRDTVVIALALPAQGVAWVAQRAGAPDKAKRIKSWVHGVPTVGYVLTSSLWALVIWRGVLYPAFGGAKNLRAS